MIVHRSGNDSVALYINETEIEELGWEVMGKEQARILTEDALKGLGLQVRFLREIEAYTGANGVMIFASLKSGSEWETCFFSFENVDYLLGAAYSISGSPPAKSTLYLYNGSYILCVSDSGVRFCQAVLRLSEYGTELSYPEAYALFLEEHGKILAANNALEQLAR